MRTRDIAYEILQMWGCARSYIPTRNYRTGRVTWSKRTLRQNDVFLIETFGDEDLTRDNHETDQPS